MYDSNILIAIEQIKSLNESRDYWKVLADELKAELVAAQNVVKHQGESLQSIDEITDKLLAENTGYLRNFVAILDHDGGHAQTGESPAQTAKRAEKALYALLASKDKAEDE